MIKGFFVLSDNDYKHNNNAGSGVFKKIDAQIKALNKDGLECGVVNLPKLGNKLVLLISFLITMPYKNIKIPFADFLYIRKSHVVNKSFIAFLKKFKTFNPDSVIIFEIPTYPYDSEYKAFLKKVILRIDRYYRKKLYKYVDLITTYSLHKKIFNIPSLQIVNGIDCSLIPVMTPHSIGSSEINLIIVAQFSFWHGYDRLIRGLINYYKTNPSKKVFLHLVGEGEELEKYKKIVKSNNFEDFIIFYGKLSGKELDIVFNKSDIAVNSLGCHRMNIFIGSFLKSREYLARGIPMISSTKIDVLPDGFPYCLYVPEDESLIDINSIIEFYENLKKLESRESQISKIREFAEENVNMTIAMKPVIEYIKNKVSRI